MGQTQLFLILEENWTDSKNDTMKMHLTPEWNTKK